MGRIGYGYGSEWHLLRYLGRHRQFLNEQILKEIGIQNASIEWIDFNFNPFNEFLDGELQGLEFFKGTRYAPIFETYHKWWPNTGRKPTWDSVAWLHNADGTEPSLLLVEAKAHVAEMRSDANASEQSQKRIRRAFDEVQAALGIQCNNDWLKSCYQHANRVATTWFLNNHKKVAKRLGLYEDAKNLHTRLVNIYFIGERRLTWDCPETEEQWKIYISERDYYLGLNESHELTEQIHTLFLPLRTTN